MHPRCSIRTRFRLSGFRAVLIVTFIALAGAPAQAQKRVALVIGNAAYQDEERALTQSVRDARAFAEEMRRNGFDVVIEENLSKNAVRRALDAFKAKIKPGSTALFFFSGFGVQSSRQSYLMPVDAQIWSEADVRRDGIDVESVLTDMTDKGAGPKIVILDASRHNSFERRFRAVSAGLAPIVVPVGSLVMYSAGPNQLTHEKDAENGLFVGELLREIRTPGIGAEEALSRTRISVARVSGARQFPWLSSTMLEDFSFEPRHDAPRPAVAAEPQPAKREVLAGHSVTPTPPGQRAMLPTADPAPAKAPADISTPAPAPIVVAAPAVALAAVPSVAEPQKPSPMREGDTVKLLHVELQRVGCLTGLIEGQWTSRSRKAMELYNQHARTRFDVAAANAETLIAVRDKSGRVCPLTCGRGTEAQGNQCVAIVCRSGYELNRHGNCERVKARSRTAAKTRDDPRPRRKVPIEGAAVPEKNTKTSAVYCGRFGCRPGRWQETPGPGCRRVGLKHFCQ